MFEKIKCNLYVARDDLSDGRGDEAAGDDDRQRDSEHEPEKEDQDDDNDQDSDADAVMVIDKPVIKLMTTTRANKRRGPLHATFADRVESNFLNGRQLAMAFGGAKISRPGIPHRVRLSDQTKDAYEQLWRIGKKTLDNENDRDNALSLWERTIKAWCAIPHIGGPQWIEFAELEIVRFMIVMVFKGWIIPDTPDREQDMPAIVCSVENGYAKVLFLTSLKLPQLVEDDDGEILFEDEELVTVSTSALLPASVYPLRSNKTRNFKSGYQVGEHVVPFAVCISSTVHMFPSVWNVKHSNSFLVAVAGKTSKDTKGREPWPFLYEDVRPLNIHDQSVPLDYDTTTHKFRRITKRRWTAICREENILEECQPIKAGLHTEDW